MIKKSNINFYVFLSNKIVFLSFLNLLVAVFMSFISPHFLRIENLLGMTQFGAVIALISLGESLVILGGGGGIDLSVGSILSLSGVLLGLMVNAGVNIWLACIITIFIGLLLGFINGFLVAYAKMPPFVVTLGTLYTFGALALVLTNGVPISGFPKSFGFIGQKCILSIPAQVLLVVIPSFIILNWVMKRTVFGRSIYLVGVNENAANLSGINVKKIRMSVYAISGMFASMAAIVMASWLMAARPDAGNGYELQAITVSVLGGINIVGGEGSLSGTMLAVLIITIIGYGLQLSNINSIWQLAVLGLLLLGAVTLNNLLERRV